VSKDGAPRFREEKAGVPVAMWQGGCLGAGLGKGKVRKTAGNAEPFHKIKEKKKKIVRHTGYPVLGGGFRGLLRSGSSI